MENKIIRLKTAESTNTELKILANNGAKTGTVIIAEKQTSGRGTHDRSFESPAGGLYLSYLINVDTSPEETMSITKWAAIGAYQAIKNSYGIECDIKYVNDLLINGKKVSGILTELTNNHLIIGIGINVNTKTDQFSEDVQKVSTSICEALKRDADISILIDEIINQFNQLAGDWPNNGWRMVEYNKRVLK